MRVDPLRKSSLGKTPPPPFPLTRHDSFPRSISDLTVFLIFVAFVTLLPGSPGHGDTYNILYSTPEIGRAIRSILDVLYIVLVGGVRAEGRELACASIYLCLPPIFSDKVARLVSSSPQPSSWYSARVYTSSFCGQLGII